jgi:hypothetical protein
MAKTPTERKRDQRERDKMTKAEKEAALLSRQIVTKLYHTMTPRLNGSWPGPGSTKSKTLFLDSSVAPTA